MKKIKANQFDKMFDAGLDISPYIDFANAKRPNLDKKTIVPSSIEHSNTNHANINSCPKQKPN